MKLLQEHALNHVRDGLTTLEEVQRVVPLSIPRQEGCCRTCFRELALQFMFCPFCGERRAEQPREKRLPDLTGNSAAYNEVIPFK